MYNGCKTMSKEKDDDDVIDDVIRSKVGQHLNLCISLDI